MYNPDGSEAEMCGNGLRCAGRYAIEALQKASVQIETPRATLRVSQTEPLQPGVPTYAAEIGPVSLQTATLPMRTSQAHWHNQPIPGLPENLRFTALSIPNPHIVTFVEQIDETAIQQIGKTANELDIFPQGVNLSAVKKMGQNTIFVMTYERGAGITQACGTAMSASSYVSVLQNHTQATQPILVYNKGGMVSCEVKQDQQQVILRGNATYTENYTVSLNETGTNILECHTEHSYEAEQQAYAALQTKVKLAVPQAFFSKP
jgi:diaminopimelate epimerase